MFLGWPPVTDDYSEERNLLTMNRHFNTTIKGKKKCHLAFGFITLSSKSRKNLAICGDSIPSERWQPRLLDSQSLPEINRFQHFKDGSWSCGDFCRLRKD
jgi:hypothetical protein